MISLRVIEEGGKAPVSVSLLSFSKRISSTPVSLLSENHFSFVEQKFVVRQRRLSQSGWCNTANKLR